MADTSRRMFDLDIILAITHCLPSYAEPYQEILKHMTGEELSPMQAIRAREECAEWLIEQHPALSGFQMPQFHEDDYAAMDAWAEEVKQELGTRELAVSPLPPGRRERASLIEDTLDVVPPSKVFVFDPRKR